MATSGYRGDDGDNKEDQGSMKWPLEYVNETKEFMCGWCGQALTANSSHHDIQMHFQSCKNSKETALLKGYKDLLKVNQKLEGLNADVLTKMDKMKAELIEEIDAKLLNLKAEVGKELEMNKMEFGKGNMELKTEIVNVLDEGMKEQMKEMSRTQEIKMAELNGRFTGVTETISTVVRSMVEDRLKTETEALWVQLRKSEQAFQNTKTQLEDEVTHLKTGQETLSEQMKTNDKDLQVQKRQSENENKEMEANQQLVKRKKIVHQEPTIFHQLPFVHKLKINCFNLLTQNHWFSRSYEWKINRIAATFAQKTFKMSGEVFQWGSYPVEARAKLQLKENDCVYISLSLEDLFKDKGKLKDLSPIPQIFYLIKNFYSQNHKCCKMAYLFDTTINYLLAFETYLGHKSEFTGLACNVGKSEIAIEIFVEPSEMTEHVHSYDGTLEWKIENYERRLQLRKSYFGFYQKNPYFYTSPRGYRVQVEICLKEEVKGKGRLITIISFLTGKFDAELSKSFLHSTTVTLINRKDPQRSINKTIGIDMKNIKEYALEVCKVEEAANLVENDTLFCKVVIKAY